MRDLHEVNCDGTILDLTKHGIREAAEMGKRIVWNHKGLRRLVPPAIIESELQLYDEYRSRSRQLDALPERIGQVIWGQTILLPVVESRDLDRFDTKT